MIVQFILLVIFSYLVGSIPTAYLTGRLLKGIDIREVGSGNVGATNVFRTVGKTTGVIVLFIDITKGVVPVVIASRIFPEPYTEAAQILTGIAAICGHNWTVFLKFKGGKGVATSTGVVLSLVPMAALTALGIFIATVAITRYISVGSIVAAAILPILVKIMYPSQNVLFIFTLLLSLLIILKHKSNIQRLLKHEEHKFSFKKTGSSE